METNKQKGRGANSDIHNPFESLQYVKEELTAVDDWEVDTRRTQVFVDNPKQILSKNASPDLPFEWSINPYQGCEHGCVYCYARNSHTYWGFNAGLDFESKIVVKPEAAKLLDIALSKKSWKPSVVMLSGNTDCYQPLERKWKITRQLLEVFWKYRNPTTIITKNALIERDIDILKKMADEKLVKVNFSITSLKEDVRQLLEPRTSAVAKKMKAIESLSKAGIPIGVMIGPVIPSLNDEEIPEILKQAGNAGASYASYTALRLNGQLNCLFENWLEEHFPERKQKIIHQVQEMHGGQLNDSQWGRRMRGSGEWADTIKQLFEVSKRKYIPDIDHGDLDTSKFRRTGQTGLFD